MSATCPSALAPDELAAYWSDDLAPADVDRIDEHLMGCAVCSAASVRVAAVTEALRSMIPTFVDHAKLEVLRARGLRIEENPLQPDERKSVVFRAELDLLIHKLGGLDLTSVENVGIVVTVEETGQVLVDEPSMPFDRDSGEVLIACQRHFVAFPPNIVAEVRVRDATGATRTARYPIPHVFERRAGE